jgi:tetratricopeptide (TPR) repeat protein
MTRLAYFNRASAYVLMREYDKAIGDFTDAIRLEAEDAAAYFGRSIAYEAKGDHSEAEADRTKAYELDPRLDDGSGVDMTHSEATLLPSQPGGNCLPEVVGYATDDKGDRHPVHRGCIKNDPLSPEQLQRVARLRDALSEVAPATVHGWVDAFRRDRDPESEIRLVEACAAVYQRLTARLSLTPDEKNRLYVVLCRISMGDEGPELSAELSASERLPSLDNIVRMYEQACRDGSRPQ